MGFSSHSKHRGGIGRRAIVVGLGSLRANIVGEVVVGYSSGPGLSHSIDRGGIGRRV